VEHPLLAQKVLTLSFSVRVPILAGFGFARVGLSFSYFFIPQFRHAGTGGSRDLFSYVSLRNHTLLHSKNARDLGSAIMEGASPESLSPR